MKKPAQHLQKGEIRYHGKNSAFAIAKARSKDILKVYIQKEFTDSYSALIKELQTARKPLQIVANQDLERLTDTTHHQGICMVAKERPLLSDSLFLKELRNTRQMIFYLDGVGNPHNLGAILRTAAHFGIPHICLPHSSLPRISASMHRTSEGAAEFVSIVQVKDPLFFLSSLKKRDFQLYGMENIDSAIPLYGSRFSEKSIFILGSEVHGISNDVQELLDTSVRIPGTGIMDSLNVSVAAALTMGEFVRQGLEKNVRFVKKPL